MRAPLIEDVGRRSSSTSTPCCSRRRMVSCIAVWSIPVRFWDARQFDPVSASERAFACSKSTVPQREGDPWSLLSRGPGSKGSVQSLNEASFLQHLTPRRPLQLVASNVQHARSWCTRPSRPAASQVKPHAALGESLSGSATMATPECSQLTDTLANALKSEKNFQSSLVTVCDFELWKKYFFSKLSRLLLSHPQMSTP